MYRRRRNTRRKRSGRYIRRRQGKRFQSRVKRVMMKQVETKYYTIGIENDQLYHNVLYCPPALYNPYFDPTNTATRTGRIGTEIVPRGVKVRMWLANKLDRPNMMYRIIVGVAPKTIGNTLVTSAIVESQLLNATLDQGTLGNKMILPPNLADGFKVLRDRVITTNGSVHVQAANKERHNLVRLWIKPKKGQKIRYTDTNFVVNRALFVAICCYDSYATSALDNIASFAYHATVYYKDP